MENFSTKSPDGHCFAIGLPLEKGFEQNLCMIAQMIDESGLDDMRQACNEIEVYETMIFNKYRRIMSDFFEQAIDQKCEIRKLKFIYRIDLMHDWNGEMIIADENLGTISRQTVRGPETICDYHAACVSEDALKIQEYMLMKILLDFNAFYRLQGRIYPAFIEIVFRESAFEFLKRSMKRGSATKGIS